MKDLKAKDVMTTSVVSADKKTSAIDITMELLKGLYSGIPITDDNGKVVGVVTEIDLLGYLRRGKELIHLIAEDVIQQEPITADVNTPILDVLTLMLENHIIRVPVTDEDRLVGIIARRDILKAYLKPYSLTRDPEEHFGQFLVKEGIVNEADVVTALNIQKRRTIPIGELAAKYNMLSMQDVFNVLNAQQRSTKRFGEIAVDLGYITKEGVDVLLRLQKESRPRIGEILVELKKVEHDVIEILVKKYMCTLTPATIK
jgi:CBS domain-containing protein